MRPACPAPEAAPPSERFRAASEAFRERLGSRPWRVLRTGADSGAHNMALDEALLVAAAHEDSPPTLRFYGWDPPAVSLGRFQSEDGIRLQALRERGWELVRRPTGGRAVLHHLEVTYSIVLPPSIVAGAGIRTSYAVLSGALGAGLRSLVGPWAGEGLEQRASAAERPSAASPNCFALAAGCDTPMAGGKLAGSAQVRRDGALLQHGSILLDAESKAWTALFGSTGRLVTLRQLLGETPQPEQVEAAVIASFRDIGVRLQE